MEGTPIGQTIVLVAQQVAQVYIHDIETVHNPLQKIMGKIALDSEILKKPSHVLISAHQVKFIRVGKIILIRKITRARRKYYFLQ